MSDRGVRKTVQERIVLRRKILKDVRSIEPLDDLEAEYQRDAIEWINTRGRDVDNYDAPTTGKKSLPPARTI